MISKVLLSYFVAFTGNPGLGLMRRGARFFVSILCIACNTGCNSGAKQYKSPDGKFSIEFPATPTVEPDEDGVHKVSATLKGDRDLLFFVRYKDYPGDLSEARFQEIVAFGRNALLKREGSKLLDEKRVQTGKYMGTESKIAIAQFDDISHSRDFAVGNRYYTLTVIYSKHSADSPAIVKFFDSFRVNE
jgi:hypothetical protein